MDYFIPIVGQVLSKSHNRVMMFSHGKRTVVTSLSLELPKHFFLI